MQLKWATFMNWTCERVLNLLNNSSKAKIGCTVSQSHREGGRMGEEVPQGLKV